MFSVNENIHHTTRHDSTRHDSTAFLFDPSKMAKKHDKTKLRTFPQHLINVRYQTSDKNVEVLSFSASIYRNYVILSLGQTSNSSEKKKKKKKTTIEPSHIFWLHFQTFSSIKSSLYCTSWFASSVSLVTSLLRMYNELNALRSASTLCSTFARWCDVLCGSSVIWFRFILFGGFYVISPLPNASNTL